MPTQQVPKMTFSSMPVTAAEIIIKLEPFLSANPAT